MTKSKILIVSDAWHQQVNGVVRTLEKTIHELQRMGHDVLVVGPDVKRWCTFPLPFYPDIKIEFFSRMRLARIMNNYRPGCVHIATEGALGWAMRRLCVQQGRVFTTSYHTQFPEYVAARMPHLLRPMTLHFIYALERHFHNAATAVMVATDSMLELLRGKGFHHLVCWSRGVDTHLFRDYDDSGIYADLPRPVLLNVGRVATEKNLEAFLSLDTPGSKVVIGTGPDLEILSCKYPAVHFLGFMEGEKLARHYAAADVFVFPSLTDTFGLVLLEACASGLRVAAYQATAPADIFCSPESREFAVLDENLEQAVARALALSGDRKKPREFAQKHSWRACTEQFLQHALVLPNATQRIWPARTRFAIDVSMIVKKLYRALTDTGAPLIQLYLAKRRAAGREDAARFNERLGEASVARPVGKLIWCHAASVGEAASLLALIAALRQQYTSANILVTTGTVTSARMLANRLPAGVIHQYIPVDRAIYVQKFLNHWKPDLALWIESELWPNMLAELHAHNIPAVLLNGRMSENSFRSWRFASGWAKELLATFPLILAQTDEDASRFTVLGASAVRCIGNLKYAASPLPYDETALAALREAIGTRPVWVAASTHAGEEEIIAATHRSLARFIPNLLTIIVPRHATRGENIARQLMADRFMVARRSLQKPITAMTQIYLADTMGELGLFYRLASVVVMGGSLVPVGGHNPIEPAQLGAAIIFGPHMHNFAAMTREFVDRGAALQLTQTSGLFETLRALLTNKAQREKLAQAAQALADEKKKVLADTMGELKPWLGDA